VGSGVKGCVVVLPNGTEAVDAVIWVGTEKNPSLSSFRPGEYYPRGMEKLKHTKSGNPDLPLIPPSSSCQQAPVICL